MSMCYLHHQKQIHEEGDKIHPSEQILGLALDPSLAFWGPL